jgi:DNA replication protein DnaC
MKKAADVLKHYTTGPFERDTNIRRDPEAGRLYRPNPECPQCKGAGFVHPVTPLGQVLYDKAVPCQCYLDSASAYQRGEAQSRPAPQGKTFDNFYMLPGSRDAYKTTKEWVEAKDFIWLLVYGGVGNGKSHLCEAASRALHDRKEQCRMITTSEMHAQIRRSVNDDTGKDMVLDSYKRTQWLIMDEWRLDRENEAQTSNIEDILLARYENVLPTMVVTNVDITQLPPRIASRFQDVQMSRCIANTAPDYRVQK